MSRGHVRPWPQPRALLRAGVGAASCAALGFCAFTSLCEALYLKSGLWRPWVRTMVVQGWQGWRTDT